MKVRNLYLTRISLRGTVSEAIKYKRYAIGKLERLAIQQEYTGAPIIQRRIAVTGGRILINIEHNIASIDILVVTGGGNIFMAGEFDTHPLFVYNPELNQFKQAKLPAAAPSSGYSISYNELNKYVYVGFEDSVYITKDGQNWTALTLPGVGKVAYIIFDDRTVDPENPTGDMYVLATFADPDPNEAQLGMFVFPGGAILPEGGPPYTQNYNKGYRVGPNGMSHGAVFNGKFYINNEDGGDDTIKDIDTAETVLTPTLDIGLYLYDIDTDSWSEWPHDDEGGAIEAPPNPDFRFRVYNDKMYFGSYNGIIYVLDGAGNVTPRGQNIAGENLNLEWKIDSKSGDIYLIGQGFDNFPTSRTMKLYRLPDASDTYVELAAGESRDSGVGLRRIAIFEKDEGPDIFLAGDQDEWENLEGTQFVYRTSTSQVQAIPPDLTADYVASSDFFVIKDLVALPEGVALAEEPEV